MSRKLFSVFILASIVAPATFAAPLPIPRLNGMAMTTNRLKNPQLSKAMVDSIRQRIRQKVVRTGRAAFGLNDNPANLIEGQFTSNIYEMAGKETAALTGEAHPWSDTYWPLYQGQIAARYADPNFQPDAANFLNTFKTFTDGASQCERENLSPAEKYDLLMGLNPNSPASLTAKAWESARSMARNGVVEPWMGICHGWAPAAYMLPRPKKAVTLMASDGQPVTFYVSDIKALGTLLWATASTESRFIGGRCNMKQSDLIALGDNARKMHPECWDTNAGTWHTVLINQLAKGRSFVMDATHDYEVWNQPVQAYSLKYYSPITNRPGNLNTTAVVDYATYAAQKGDPFAKLRDRRKVKYLVGVKMELIYGAENYPSHANSTRDAIQKKEYKYDLELDANGNIVGGEWHQDDHPDFLWTPPFEVGSNRQKSHINNSQGVRSSWNPLTSRVPADWTQAAAGVALGDQPLSHVVDLLFGLARK